MRVTKRKLVLALILLSVTSLSWPSRPATAAMEFCETCGNNAYNDAWGWPTGEYSKCRDAGGSTSDCQTAATNLYNDRVMVCNWAGCNIPYIH